MRPDTNGAGSGRLQPPPLIAPAFEVSEQGKPTKEWEVVQTDLFDSLGNQPSVWPFKTPFLCPFEPAWKLRVKFCGKEISGVASNSCWTVRHLKLQGRIFFAKIWEWDLPSGGFKQSNGFYLPFKRDSHYFLGFDIPSEVTELGLTVCVHRAPTVEFVVQPPRPSP